MKLNYSAEEYKFWVNFWFTTFERKVQKETAFDGIVKIYSLKSDNDQLNKLIKDKLFGDFIFPSDRGIFLRMFKSKSSWPNSKLIHIDLEKYIVDEIVETSSSWNLWTGNNLGYGRFAINISPKEMIEYTTY
jgi:hypothetical protein